MNERQVPDKKELDASHSDPANWRWVFYYNKRDPRILPPKRNPAMGLTINFANPRSVALLIGMTVFTSAFLSLLIYLLERS
jgi:uncharacterized membrane protein